MVVPTRTPFQSTAVTSEIQIRYYAASIAKFVLACVPDGFASRDRAVMLLRDASGEEHTYWRGPGNLDVHDQQSLLFTAYHHVLGNTQGWYMGEVGRALDQLETLRESLSALRKQLHRDLLQLQLNLGWGGDVSDAATEAYITQATKKANLNPFQRKRQTARKNPVTPKKSLTRPRENPPSRPEKRKHGELDPDVLDNRDGDVDFDDHGDEIDDRKSKRRSSNNAQS